MLRHKTPTRTDTVTGQRMRELALFSTCTRHELGRLSAAMTEHHAEPGDVLATEGAPGYEFFVIVEGSASVMIGGQRVAMLRRGDFFGEVALLDNLPRTATVIADTAMTLVVSSLPEFAGIIAQSPNFTRKLLAGVSCRLRDTMRTATSVRSSARP